MISVGHIIRTIELIGVKDEQYKENIYYSTGCLVLKFMEDIFNSAQPMCLVLPVDQINPAT